MTVGSDPATVEVGVAAHRQRVLQAETPAPPNFNIATACCDRWPRDRVALVDARASQSRRVTFGTLSSQSSRLANALAARSIGFGDRVLVGLPQGLEAAITHLAIARLAAISVPLSVMHGEEAVKARLATSGARAGVIDGEAMAWLADSDLVSEADWLVVGGPTPAPDGMSDFESVLEAGREHHELPTITSETPATLIFTSGTTGAAKGALHAHRVVHAHQAPLSLLHNGFPQPHDLFWSPADWAWAGGLIDCLFGALSSGAPILAYRGRRFDPEEVVSLIERYQVTNTFLPPTAIKMLRSASVAPKNRLRSVMTGGETVDAGLFDWCHENLGVYPNTAYGQTEASCIVGASDTLPPRPGSLGMELPGSAIAVLDEDDIPVPDGTVGEICVSASSAPVFLRYWDNQEATEAKVRSGWLRTGDLGWRDEDGYLWFSSRNDDLIMSAGYRIGPTEIEACLESHPGVRAAAVVGLHDSDRGEVVAAFVEVMDEANPDSLPSELQDLVRTRLAPYQVPKVVEVVEALPRTVTGKVQRAALRMRGSV